MINHLKRKANLISTETNFDSENEALSIAKKIFFFHFRDDYHNKNLKIYSVKQQSHKKYPNIKINPHFIRDDGTAIYLELTYGDNNIFNITDDTIQITMDILKIKKTIIATINLTVPVVEIDTEIDNIYDSINCSYVDYSSEMAKQYIISQTRKKFKKSPKTKVEQPIQGFNSKEWVSASKTKNYVLNDPLIDWLEFSESKNSLPDKTCIELSESEIIMEDCNEIVPPRETPSLKTKGLVPVGETPSLKTKGLVPVGETPPLRTNDFDSYIKNKGIEFETCVIELIKKKIPTQDFVTICHNMDQYHQNILKYEKKTIEEINKGTPFIYQAVLLNRTGKLKGSYGMPDLLVRSDHLSKILTKEIIFDGDIYRKAPKLSGSYHYVVVDIKFSTLELCYDGRRIRNSGYFPAYKCQLYIYNHALGNIQGYEPPSAYILGRKYRFTIMNNVHRGNNCFDSIGHIEYDGWDKEFINKTIKAIKWIKNLRENGNKWKLFPKPSVKELYPNMCNMLDTKWSEFKHSYARKIGEISLLWNCGVKHRRIAHKNKIFHIHDKKCDASNLGINGLIQGPLLNSIIRINKKKYFDSMLDRISIFTEKGDPDTELMINPHVRISVDFETIGNVFDDFKQLPYASDINYLFMIGVGYKIGSDPVKYKMFILSELSINAEFQLIYQFYSFIKEIIDNNVKEGDLIPPLCHYGHFEKSLFNTLCAKLKREIGIDVHADLDKIRGYIEWFDLAKYMKNNHFVVNGCYKFGLKELAGQLGNLGLIKTKWPKSNNSQIKPDKGITAMIMAYNAYHEVGIQINQNPIMQSIMEYNKVDCLVIHEIMDIIGQKIMKENPKDYDFDDLIDNQMILDI